MNQIIIIAILLCCACKKPETGQGPSPGGSGSTIGSGQASAAGGTAPVITDATPLDMIPAGGTLSNSAGDAVPLACTQQAREVKGNQGTSWYMSCPPCPELTGSVWGTDLYTDDSKLCAAAVHSGKLGRTGGIALVTWVGGQSTYVGSTQNGVTTSDYAKWQRSFFVQSVDAEGRPTSPPVAPPPAGTVRLSCAMPANWLDRALPTLRVQCPTGCSSGRLWGTDVYTADSSVCLAGVHAGLTTVEHGGELTLTLGGAVEAFTGTARNGVASNSYGRYDATFRVAK